MCAVKTLTSSVRLQFSGASCTGRSAVFLGNMQPQLHQQVRRGGLGGEDSNPAEGQYSPVTCSLDTRIDSVHTCIHFFLCLYFLTMRFFFFGALLSQRQ